MKIIPRNFSAAVRRRVLSAMLLLGVACAPVASAQGLVYHYTFDEAEGGSVADAVGGRDVLLRGTTTWGPGVGSGTGGLALTATGLAAGTGAEASGFTGEAVIGLTQYTFTGWFQVSGTPQGTLLSLQNSAAETVFYLTIAGASGNQLRAVGQGGRNILSTTSSIISDSGGEWVFFALTIDSTHLSAGANWVNAVKFYVANEDSETLTQLGNSGVSINGDWNTEENGTAPGVIGTALVGIDGIVLGNNHGTDAATWRALNSNGLLDDFRLYDGVLDAAALDAIRLQTIPEPGASVGWAGAVVIVIALTRRRSARPRL